MSEAKKIEQMPEQQTTIHSGCTTIGEQIGPSSTVKILEVAYSIGGYTIIVQRDGTVGYENTKKDAIPFYEQPMPRKSFWDGLQAMLESMALEIANLQVDRCNLVHQLADEDKRMSEPKRKFIPVGSNKKEMFAAGVTFGRNTRK